jgi:carbonic anhydrase
MKTRLTFLESIGLVLLACCAPALPAQEAAITPAAALERLKEGNKRFAADRLADKDLGSARRRALAKGQRPFAVVLGCADSRVAPELIFDQGLGDVFVLRVAGNVTDAALVGSIEYAVEEVKVPLIVVLGHEECGAVKAALAGKPLPGDLGELIRRVDVGKPPPAAGADALPAAVWANAIHSAQELGTESGYQGVCGTGPGADRGWSLLLAVGKGGLAGIARQARAGETTRSSTLRS